MGCSPEIQVMPVAGQGSHEPEPESFGVYSCEISIPDISVERQARCNSYVGKPRVAADFFDDMAMRERGGDLKYVQVSDSARTVAYISEDGRRITRSFVYGQVIPLYIVHDGVCYKKASKRAPAAVLEDEDYFNYETQTSITVYFGKGDTKHEQVTKNGIVYFRRPPTYEYVSGYPTENSVSDEFANDRFDVERRHFSRGYVIPEHLLLEMQLDEDVCEVSDFRRIKAELCQEDCTVEYINYESQAVVQRAFLRNQIIRKIIVVMQNGVPVKFVRRVDPLVIQPEGSFSEEFVDDSGVVMRKHFARAERRTQELVCTRASATNGIQHHIFRRKTKEIYRTAAESAAAQPEADSSQGEAVDLNFDAVVRMDFSGDFCGKEEPARRYAFYEPTEEELQVLQHYNQLGNPVTCEAVAQLLSIDAYQVKQALLQVGSYDLDNVTFWQFENLVSRFAGAELESWRRSGDLLETDLLD